MNDNDYMKLALQLAKSATGQTSPNPVVGAVVVKNGEILGVGAHLKAGEPHAEVHAIRMAGEKAKGATIYVTLEPCSHFGKTPPCANLIIEKELSRVVIATFDPNPDVAGKGIERIQRAGIHVDVGICKEEADELNKIFFHYIRYRRPYVLLKTAISLDGKIATKTGDSKWITSAEAREDVHYYRHHYDAILVGVNTVIKDNPSLTTRLPNGGKNPIRIVLDTHLKTPPQANVVTDGLAKTIILTGCNVKKEQINAFNLEHLQIITLDEEEILITKVLDKLGELGITSLFVEGGSQVNGSFLQNKMVNEVVTYIAPKLIGGNNAPTSIGGLGFETMNDVLALEIKEVKRIGQDIKVVSVPKEE